MYTEFWWVNFKASDHSEDLGIGKVRPTTCLCMTEGGRRLRDKPLATFTIDGSGLSAPRLVRFIPRKSPVPIVQHVWWASGPVWTGKEDLAPTGNRSPVHSI